MGITAHNEAANIGRLLEAISQQRLSLVDPTHIVVVASGCTDGTEDIVRDHMKRDERIELLVQESREGKASAINLFLTRASEPLVVLCSADLIPEENALEALVAPFADPEIGMTGAHPVPVNDRSTFLGFAVGMLWDLHHHMNMSGGFKAGEMVAFRRIFERIPNHTAVDEASVEPIIRAQGYRVQYAADAIVYNKGPETIGDFLRQRRRIYAGHLELARDLGYTVSTMSGGTIVKLFLTHLDWRPKQLIWSVGTAFMEVAGRWLGRKDFKNNASHTIWEIATTTKRLGDVQDELEAKGERKRPKIDYEID